MFYNIILQPKSGIADCYSGRERLISGCKVTTYNVRKAD